MCIGDDCYEEIEAIQKYLNLPEVQDILGVETPFNFTYFSRSVSVDFNAHLDWSFPTYYYVASLLDRGIPILIYAGTFDWQCNWVTNKLWVDKLEWSGMDAYKDASWSDWFVGGHKAGEIKETPLLTFATVRSAGHMMSSFLYFDVECADFGASPL